MADQNQGGFPPNQSQGQSTFSTTGDGHPPRPGEQRDNADRMGERATQDDMAGQGTGQMTNNRETSGASDTEGQFDTAMKPTSSSVGGDTTTGGTVTSGTTGSATGGGMMGAGTSSRTFEDAENM